MQPLLLPSPLTPPTPPLPPLSPHPQQTIVSTLDAGEKPNPRCTRPSMYRSKTRRLHFVAVRS